MNELYMDRVLTEAKMVLQVKPNTGFRIFRATGWAGSTYTMFVEAIGHLVSRGDLLRLGTAASIGFNERGIAGKSIIYALPDYVAERKEKPILKKTLPKYHHDIWAGQLGKSPSVWKRETPQDRQAACEGTR